MVDAASAPRDCCTVMPLWSGLAGLAVQFLRGCRSRVGVPASGSFDLFPARINQELKNSRMVQECAVSTNKFLIS